MTTGRPMPRTRAPRVGGTAKKKPLGANAPYRKSKNDLRTPEQLPKTVGEAKEYDKRMQERIRRMRIAKIARARKLEPPADQAVGTTEVSVEVELTVGESAVGRAA